MKRSDFMKLAAAGLFIPVAPAACSKSKKKKASGDNKYGRTASANKKQLAKTEALHEYKNSDQVNVKDFGAKGDGSGVDDQPAIQKAIDYASKNDIKEVVIPEGDYTIDLNLKEIRPTALVLRDDIHLKMDNKTKLRLKDGANEVKYNMLSVLNRKNVTIEGGTIIGNKSTRKGKPKGEFGFGILLISSKNVTVKNTNLNEQWGDGIYIGRYGGKAAKCQNITIKDTICDNNRRQGMSVISVDGLKVNDCEFNNTSGTKPAAGIDFEPNKPDETLQNIHLNNIRCIGNAGAGILLVLSGLESPNKPKITIDVKNAYIANSGGIGIAITKHFDVAGTGHLNFEDVTVKNNGSRAAFYIRNWNKDAPPVTFKNITAINPNTGGKGGTTQGSAFVFYDNDPGFKKGNVHVDGFQVKSDSSATGRAPRNIYINPKVWNCSFKNIQGNRHAVFYLSRLDQKNNNVLGPALAKKLKK